MSAAKQHKAILREFPLPMGERRKTPDGRVLHCCCVCNVVEPWSKDWSWYGSYLEEENGVPLQKFCSERCKKQQAAVTIEMAALAREKEYRSQAA